MSEVAEGRVDTSDAMMMDTVTSGTTSQAASVQQQQQPPQASPLAPARLSNLSDYELHGEDIRPELPEQHAPAPPAAHSPAGSAGAAGQGMSPESPAVAPPGKRRRFMAKMNKLFHK
jgi:hypothetical protein